MGKKSISLTFLVLKPFIYLLLPFVLVMSVFPGPTGRPMLDWVPLISRAQNVLQPVKATLKDVPIASNPLSSKVELYRYKDENDKWVFSSEKPANVDVEIIIVNTNENIIAPPVDLDAKGDSSSAGFTMSGSPIEFIQKDVKNLQKMSKEHNEKLDEL